MIWAANYVNYANFFAAGLNISRPVIGCAMAVHRELANGFLEIINERALEIELETQVSLPVSYKGKQIVNVRRQQSKPVKTLWEARLWEARPRGDGF